MTNTQLAQAGPKINWISYLAPFALILAIPGLTYQVLHDYLLLWCFPEVSAKSFETFASQNAILFVTFLSRIRLPAYACGILAPIIAIAVFGYCVMYRAGTRWAFIFICGALVLSGIWWLLLAHTPGHTTSVSPRRARWEVLPAPTLVAGTIWGSSMRADASPGYRPFSAIPSSSPFRLANPLPTESTGDGLTRTDRPRINPPPDTPTDPPTAGPEAAAEDGLANAGPEAAGSGWSGRGDRHADQSR